MIFERGYFVDSVISNYDDYRNKDYIQLARDLIMAMKIKPDRHILDYGCATGLLVYCFRQLGFPRIVGTDISYWAINYGRRNFGVGRDVLYHYNRSLLEDGFDFLFFLDVLEHIPTEELEAMMPLIAVDTIAVRVPVSFSEGDGFVLDVHKVDKTHFQIHCKDWWDNFMQRFGFVCCGVFSHQEIYESKGVLARTYKRGG